MNSRRILTGASVVAGVFEVVQSPFMDAVSGKATAFAFGVAFLALAWVLQRRTTVPTVVLGVMFGIEVAFLPVYDRVTTADWVEQVGFGVVSVAGLVGVVGVLLGHRRGVGVPAQSLRTRT